ncbi:Methylthioribose-1-phosphate isomerase [subsurface metagenome]
MISKTILHMIHDLKTDKTSGASELIEIALEILEAQLHTINDHNIDIKEVIFEISKELFNIRPERLRIDNTLTSSFHSFLDRFEGKKLNIMLISYSTTIIKHLKENIKNDFTFYVLESRPLLEGRRTAEILSSNFETHLIADSAMGKFIKKVDIVLLGIDSVLRDGSIVNKIGSYPLACIAAANNKDVYAVGDSYKYNLKSHYNQKVIVEQKPIYEVYSKKIKKELFKVHNFYFDITPSNYFKEIISDLGILTMPEFLEKVKSTLPLEWFKSFL